ncbi:MAG: hypothetical protein WA117_07965, partial [Verrucomicrobiia bacterium]
MFAWCESNRFQYSGKKILHWFAVAAAGDAGGFSCGAGLACAGTLRRGMNKLSVLIFTALVLTPLASPRAA